MQNYFNDNNIKYNEEGEMSEKILNEFSSRISKAKFLLESTKNQCEYLKREATRLEKEYDQLKNECQNAEVIE